MRTKSPLFFYHHPSQRTHSYSLLLRPNIDDFLCSQPSYNHQMQIVIHENPIRKRVWFLKGRRTRQQPSKNKWNQFSSVTQSCPTLRDSMNCSTPGLPVHHQLPEFTQIHVHRVSDAIQPSHPLSSPSPPIPSPSQHQSLFQWVNSSHEVAKVLEFQL